MAAGVPERVYAEVRTVHDARMSARANGAGSVPDFTASRATSSPWLAWRVRRVARHEVQHQQIARAGRLSFGIAFDPRSRHGALGSERPAKRPTSIAAE